MYSSHEFFDLSEGLAYIMNELFGGVVYAGIDTDKHRYPIGKLILYNCTIKVTPQNSIHFNFFIAGSGRITFNNQKSFLDAVRSGFIEIETPKFVKKVSNL